MVWRWRSSEFMISVLILSFQTSVEALMMLLVLVPEPLLRLVVMEGVFGAGLWLVVCVVKVE